MPKLAQCEKTPEQLLALAIETSCDETCAAVVRGGREVLSNVVFSQILMHKAYGGVVPELASRKHSADITEVVSRALSDAALTLSDVDIIGVTNRPGLVGALLVGVSYAKALAFAAQKPLHGVNHIWGHVAANYISHKALQPPFISLIVSGGHTALLKITGYLHHEPLAQTLDDAAGEAFDKVARVLGLNYPGGAQIDELARRGTAGEINSFRSVCQKDGNFSYSGLKTAVLNYVNGKKMANEDFSRENLCAAFTAAALDGLCSRAREECERSGIKKLAVCGGVAANSYLRKKALELKNAGIEVFLPEPAFCGDNAAMIASCAHYMHISGARQADLTLNAYPTFIGNEE